MAKQQLSFNHVKLAITHDKPHPTRWDHYIFATMRRNISMLGGLDHEPARIF